MRKINSIQMQKCIVCFVIFKLKKRTRINPFLIITKMFYIFCLKKESYWSRIEHVAISFNEKRIDKLKTVAYFRHVSWIN